MRYSAFSLAVHLFVLVLIVYEIVKRFFVDERFNPSSLLSSWGIRIIKFFKKNGA